MPGEREIHGSRWNTTCGLQQAYEPSKSSTPTYPAVHALQTTQAAFVSFVGVARAVLQDASQATMAAML